MKKPGREGADRWKSDRGNWQGSQPRPSHANPLLGVELDEDEQRYIAGEPLSAREKPPHTPAVNAPAVRGKYTVGQVLLLIALGGLVVGTAALIVLNLYFPNWPHRKALPPPSQTTASNKAPSVAVSPTPPSTPPSVQHAASPVEAVKLMLSASARGDKATAYAQWDIAPEDIATINRGAQLTLAEQTENFAALGASYHPGEYDYQAEQQSATQARVRQYHAGALTQTYSLRRVGSYWKLYNASEPDR